jgi:hypothetical protein
VKLTTHLHPALRLRTRVTITPLSHTSPWRGTRLSTGIIVILFYAVLKCTVALTCALTVQG